MVNGKSNVYDGICVIYGGASMKTEDEWAEQAKRIVRAEMVRRGITYETLAERLAALGVHDTPVNMRNKIARGKFTATFMIQVLEAVGCKSVDLFPN
jgi:hypothetical protein